MKLLRFLPALLLAVALPALADDAKGGDSAAKANDSATKPQLSVTSGSVTVGGQKIGYKANTGTLVLKNDKNEPTVSMFYVYYAKEGANPANRPVTFFFNGGPGSATIWLHMGAFGPERVRTADDSHTPGAPYTLANNDVSLMDVTDEVFIDAPGTGFSRVLDKDLGGKGEGKDFYGVDQDAKAFSDFIQQFLSKYGRWNSPKYIFGESYGTIRGPVLTLNLQNAAVDINGLILLSAIPNTEISPDGDGLNPSIDIPFAVVLPTQAAIAWYHDKIPNKPAKLEDFLPQVEKFAMGEYLTALNQGSLLDPAEKRQVAQKLASFTGLSADYWVKANLRVTGGQFEHELLRDSNRLAGRLDGRFSGYALDPLGEFSEYDPQSSGISSAYVSLFNDYVRKTLNYGQDQSYIPLSFQVNGGWDFKHQNPFGQAFPGATNVLPDLAVAMGQNPTMKVLLTGGYYDLATAFYAAEFQMHHLPMDDKLQANISYAWYPSGHMVYANEASAKKLHDDVAKFIENSHK
ncbi:MAG TPA: peptidase S10 [Gammaproteobacteria bacterium]|jgi:carboxypeptidase C (cathepsin A)|nr:peptidase S10 [Gammaproteobacteria bacterium]